MTTKEKLAVEVMGQCLALMLEITEGCVLTPEQKQKRSIVDEKMKVVNEILNPKK